MGQGLFKLYYRDGNAKVPCVGVRYKVLGHAMSVVDDGITNAQGETHLLVIKGASQDFQLAVFDAATGQYGPPDLARTLATNRERSLVNPSGNSLQLDAEDMGVVIADLELVPFIEVRYLAHPKRRPMVGAAYKAYTIDPQGKRTLTAKPKGGAITGSTDGAGTTGRIPCAHPSNFEFQVKGTSVTQRTDVLLPMVKGQEKSHYELIFKTTVAYTAPDASTAVALQGKQSLPLLISPADEELLMIPQKDFAEFEAMAGRLERIAALTHDAKLDLTHALEAKDAKAVALAEKELAKADDSLKKELNKNFKQLADLKEVITFETVVKDKAEPGQPQQFGVRRRYMTNDAYLQAKAKRLNKSEFKFKAPFAKPVEHKELNPVTNTPEERKRYADEQAAKKNKPAPTATSGVDDSALRKAVKSQIDKIKLSHEIAKMPPTVLGQLDLAGNEFSRTLLESDSFDVSAAAQWLRFIGGAGASAEANWKDKKLKVQGNLQLRAALCEGMASATWYAPSKRGWLMSLDGEDIGAVRFEVKCELYGFAGAKLVATGTASINAEGVKAAKREVGTVLSDNFDSKVKLPRFEPMHPCEKAQANGASVGIDAFVGAEAGLTPSGDLQWLPPRENDFKTLAEVSASIGVSAGAGAKAQFAITFGNGHFRIRAAAGLCWGVGAKGALEFTVDHKKFGEFAKWVAYQLAYVGYRELVYFERDAFIAYSQLLVLCASKAGFDTKQIEGWTNDVARAFASHLMELEKAKDRDGIISNILTNPHWLIHATPETRGMLLYQVTRHGMPSHMRSPPSVSVKDYDLEVHYLPRHKEAVCAIMKSVNTVSAWSNTMQHMSKDGQKSSQDPGVNEGHVLRFLNNGLSLANLPPLAAQLSRNPALCFAPTGNAHLDKYLDWRSRLLDVFPKGYLIAQHGTVEFSLLAGHDGLVHQTFAQAIVIEDAPYRVTRVA